MSHEVKIHCPGRGERGEMREIYERQTDREEMGTGEENVTR
jgi:hypothetical protein